MDDGLKLPLTQRLTRRHLIAIDVVVALLLAGPVIARTAMEHTERPTGDGWDAVRYAAIAVACLSLPLRRWDPVRALVVVAVAIVLLVALGSHGPSVISAAAVVYSVAVATDRRTSIRAAAAVICGIVGGALVVASGPDWASMFALTPLIAVGWLAGENTRTRLAYARGLTERAAEREQERLDRALRAAADERLRIARELHDVVAHAMSVIAIRSGVARVVLETRPDEVREALGIIETTSKRALTEMRLLVGVLRQPEDGTELDPAPGLANLTELIEQVGQAGVTVDLSIEGVSPSLPAGMDLSAYRIVQEALTNVVRHGGPTTAHLTLRYASDHVDIELIDEGGAQAGGPVDRSGDGQGHGLVGMRERVGLFGGELSAGPSGRGFRVFARLPLGGAAS